MFAACKEKQNKPNMPSKNVISLPSVGHFVGNLAQFFFIKMLNALGSGNVQDIKFGAKVFILNHIMGQGTITMN